MEPKEPFSLIQNKSVMPSENYFLKNLKCLVKYLSKLLSLRGFTQKHNFPFAFDDKLSVTHVFIKQIFRAAQQARPSPSPSPGHRVG
jgi:hypothetical protein